MNITLHDIRAKLAEAESLRADALLTVRALAVGSITADRLSAQMLVSKFDGYEREFWALVKIERELIACGVVTTRHPGMEGDESSPLPKGAETRSDAPLSDSAVLTPEAAPDAASAIRRGTPMPASEPVNREPRAETLSAWSAPETAEMIAQHYASGDGF